MPVTFQLFPDLLGRSAYSIDSVAEALLSDTEGPVANLIVFVDIDAGATLQYWRVLSSTGVH
jgi:hypothetical protein